MKKIILIALMTLCMACCFAGCGKNAGETTASGGASGNAKESDDADSKQATSSDGYDLQDTLTLEEAYQTLNWFYFEESNDDVWQVKIRPEENHFVHYENYYQEREGKDAWYSMYFSSYYPEIDYEGWIGVRILETTPDSMREGIESIINGNPGAGLQYEEAEYNGFTILNPTYEETMDMVKPLSDGKCLIITFQKETETDTIAMYEPYLHTLMDDTIVPTKIKKSALDGTPYLTLFEMGWNSTGGGHLYLDSQKIKLDDKLTLDVSKYSLADFGEDIIYEFETCEYALLLMDHDCVIEEGSSSTTGSYFAFPLIFVSNENDPYSVEKLTSEFYNISTKTIAGIEFEVYEELDGYNSYYKYTTEDGYYLFYNYEKDFDERLAQMIQ